MQSVFDFQAGEQLGSSKYSQKYVTFYYHSHLTLMFYAWILADIPILLGLFGKFFGISYKVHSFLMTVVVILTIIAITLQFVEDRVLAPESARIAKLSATELFQRLQLQGFSMKGMINFLTNHVILARIMFFMVIVQAFGGYALEKLYLVKNSVASAYKKYARLSHMTLGLIIWLAAKVQLYKKQSLFHFYPWISFGMVVFSIFCFPAIAILLKIIILIPRFRRPKNMKENEQLKITEAQRKMVKAMRSGSSKYQLSRDFPENTVFIYEDKIYDLTSYLHPGGSIFFEQHNWGDITLLMNGNKADERTGVLYSHTAVAYAVLNSHLIGTLKGELVEAAVEKENQLDRTTIGAESVEQQTNRIPLYMDCLCSIKELFEVNRNYQNVTLRAGKGKSAYHYLNFGKYFLLEGFKIPHYAVEALNPVKVAQRRSILEMLTSSLRDYSLKDSPFLSTKTQTTQGEGRPNDSLTIIIDTGHKKVKNLIKQLKAASVVKINGAFGRGLPVWNGFKGRLTLLAQDSGGLPLIDFLELIFKKQAIELLKERKRMDLVSRVDLPGSGISKLSNEARFRFFGDFKSKESCLCFDLLKDMHALSQMGVSELFRTEISIGRKNDGIESSTFIRSRIIDSKFLQKNLIEDDEVGDLVLLSGSQEFMYKITKSLDGLGYPRGRLFYL